MVYGIITQKDPTTFPIPVSVRDNIKTRLSSSKKNNWWPFYKQMEEPYNDWGKFPAWQAILDGPMELILMEKIEYLLEKTKGLEM